MNFKNLKEIVRDKKARDEAGICVIEGDKVVLELLQQKKLDAIITDDPTFTADGIECHLVKSDVIQKISTCRSPQHLLGIAKIPPPTFLEKKWVLVLDRLQDPGNLGALIRCAFALGWEGIYFIEPSCDPFNDKALRASRGALFHLPYWIGSSQQMLSMAERNGSIIATADLSGETPTLQSNPIWLILGQEGSGPQKDLKKFKTFSIPMQKGAESLNVGTAGSILLYVLKQSP